jgi:hypothetical protein
MNQENNSRQDLIEAVIEILQQEANKLQVVGHTLTSSEQKRVKLLQQTIDNLQAVQNPRDEGG